MLAMVCAGLTNCGGVVGVPPPAASWPSPPSQPAPETIRYPEVRVDVPSVIANDPEAQRFLLLKNLVEAGLISPDEAASRRIANLGSLLPYSAPPPAAGLAHPVALSEIADRLSRLSVPTANTVPMVRQAERDFILDRLLPKDPTMRTPPALVDRDALATGRRRIEDLARMGLVDHDEYQREMAAILADEKALAAMPPPPPPPKKKAPHRKPHPGDLPPGTKPGDVPGGTVAYNPKGTLGLHLLSMASPDMTDKAVAALKKEYPELEPLQFKAVKTDIPDLGTTYRLMAGPLPGPEAETLCRSLRGKGQSCAITNF